ncbi:hypothetical protein [Peribacillus simplex]|uniref:hypothetical protein n=1 Tax=Peribacillus simplex TaxID=1478 RepID=UPI0035CD111C
MEEGETLLVQSGKLVVIFKTDTDASRANLLAMIIYATGPSMQLYNRGNNYGITKCGSKYETREAANSINYEYTEVYYI